MEDDSVEEVDISSVPYNINDLTKDMDKQAKISKKTKHDMPMEIVSKPIKKGTKMQQMKSKNKNKRSRSQLKF